jgi:hypothetical protein
MTATLIRHPAVAGRFYPRDPETLREEVRTYLSQTPAQKPVRALGCIVPHAGYVYSGHVAGAVFAGLEIPELCIVMCPNHTGMGRPLAIVSEGAWETPLGDVPIDTDFAAALKQRNARFFRKIQPPTVPNTPQKSSYPFCKCASPNSSSFPSLSAAESSNRSRTTRPRHRRCHRQTDSVRPHRRLQRHESLRVRHHNAREGPPAQSSPFSASMLAPCTTQSPCITSACAASVQPWLC